MKHLAFSTVASLCTAVAPQRHCYERAVRKLPLLAYWLRGEALAEVELR